MGESWIDYIIIKVDFRAKNDTREKEGHSRTIRVILLRGYNNPKYLYA